MNAQHKRIMSDEEEAAINAGIAADPDNPEWSEKLFAKATSVEDSSLPESFKRVARGGRPRKAVTRQITTMRLPIDVIEFFKAGSKDGKGWQSRLNSVLEEYVAAHKQG
jgi:uncharacterized protein (DUF4415 family)